MKHFSSYKSNTVSSASVKECLKAHLLNFNNIDFEIASWDYKENEFITNGFKCIFTKYKKGFRMELPKSKFPNAKFAFHFPTDEVILEGKGNMYFKSRNEKISWFKLKSYEDINTIFTESLSKYLINV